jgi:hypothetical protein
MKLPKLCRSNSAVVPTANDEDSMRTVAPEPEKWADRVRREQPIPIRYSNGAAYLERKGRL